MAVKLTQIRKGQVVSLEGVPHQVVDFDHNTPGNWRAMVNLKLRNMKTGAQFNKRFGATDSIETIFLGKKNAQYLGYKEGSFYVFMDTETCDQIQLDEEVLGDRMKFVAANSEVTILSLDEKPCDIELPSAVVLTVTEADPAMRGNTATNVTKRALCDTGLEVRVPPHIEVGERIKVDTATGEFLSRSKE